MIAYTLTAPPHSLLHLPVLPVFINFLLSTTILISLLLALRYSMSSNPSRCYTSAEYQFSMADPMPITFVAHAKGPSAGRQLALNTMTYVDFRSERASQSTPTNFQAMHSPNAFYNLHPNIHQMCHCSKLLEICQSPTADHIPYPNFHWNHGYEQAALYPGLEDQVCTLYLYILSS